MSGTSPRKANCRRRFNTLLRKCLSLAACSRLKLAPRQPLACDFDACQKWSNFREWAKNQHPVLSMFMAHELHPFSKTERFSVMLCYLCWAFFITAVIEAVRFAIILQQRRFSAIPAALCSINCESFPCVKPPMAEMPWGILRNAGATPYTICWSDCWMVWACALPRRATNSAVTYANK